MSEQRDELRAQHEYTVSLASEVIADRDATIRELNGEVARLTAELEATKRDNSLLRGAMDAQDERERQAGAECGIPYELHGCDWPEWVADALNAARAEIATLRARIEAGIAAAVCQHCKGAGAVEAGSPTWRWRERCLPCAESGVAGGIETTKQVIAALRGEEVRRG